MIFSGNAATTTKSALFLDSKRYKASTHLCARTHLCRNQRTTYHNRDTLYKVLTPKLVIVGILGFEGQARLHGRYVYRWFYSNKHHGGRRRPASPAANKPGMGRSSQMIGRNRNAGTDQGFHVGTATIPSGELTQQWKYPPFLMGKSTISMAIFNCYVSSPEGNQTNHAWPS